MNNARFIWLFTLIILGVFLSGCGPSYESLKAIDYTPLSGSRWETATPAEVGLDSLSLARMFYDAEHSGSTYGVLVLKDGYLVAEKYFREGSVEQKALLQSVTKSITSALAGIAIKEGYIDSIGEPVLNYYPELSERITDPRKKEITIEHLLQMRAGYPWEESSEELFALLYHGFRPSVLGDVPLIRDPGTKMEYSNLSAHLAGIAVSRASGMSLEDLADSTLFKELNIERGEWIKDWEGYNNGHGDLHLAVRDLAKFGQLYLNDGRFNGKQVIDEDWVKASFKSYSEDAWSNRVGRNFKDIEYGYLWWSVKAGKYRYNLAWGHGGQQIAIVKDLNLVIVVTADPQIGDHSGNSWKRERANLNLVADFIARLPLSE